MWLWREEEEGYRWEGEGRRVMVVDVVLVVVVVGGGMVLLPRVVWFEVEEWGVYGL